MGSGASNVPEEEMEELIESTCFNKVELKRWYTKFIREYPDGQLNLNQFNQLLGRIHTNKSSHSLANHIFRSFDHDNNGSISFKELMSSLSVTTRGTVREKLEWAFHVYDVDQDGSITMDEITAIVKCMQQNNYRGGDRSTRDITGTEICKMFESVDRNADGSLTLEEFVEGIQSHPRFVRMLNGSCSRENTSCTWNDANKQRK